MVNAVSSSCGGDARAVAVFGAANGVPLTWPSATLSHLKGAREVQEIGGDKMDISDLRRSDGNGNGRRKETPRSHVAGPIKCLGIISGIRKARGNVVGLPLLAKTVHKIAVLIFIMGIIPKYFLPGNRVVFQNTHKPQARAVVSVGYTSAQIKNWEVRR
jgi:hypothetical protein